MKLQNWLIFTGAKSALFFVAVIAAIVTPLEFLILITGRTLGIQHEAFRSWLEKESTIYDRVMIFLPAVLLTSSIAYACWQIAMVLKNIENKKEFVSRNYKRLVNAGRCIIVTDLLLLVFDVFNNNTVRSLLHAGEASHPKQEDFSFSLTGLLVGFLLIILAQVFKKGSQLHEDHTLML
jgi:hypothetical protein